MNWTPKTDEEIYADELCPKGKQPFRIIEAADQVSKSGKPMIKLKLDVQAEDGSNYHIYDYVSPSFMHFKFKHVWGSVDLSAVYEAGNGTAQQLLHREGWCEVGMQAGRDGFPPKNVILDYVVNNAAKAASEKPDNTDDVPF